MPAKKAKKATTLQKATTAARYATIVAYYCGLLLWRVAATAAVFFTAVYYALACRVDYWSGFLDEAVESSAEAAQVFYGGLCILFPAIAFTGFTILAIL